MFLSFSSLLQNTDQRTTDFKYLTSKDQELSREIEVKIRKIERLQSSLQHWRTKVCMETTTNQPHSLGDATMLAALQRTNIS